MLIFETVTRDVESVFEALPKEPKKLYPTHWSCPVEAFTIQVCSYPAATLAAPEEE